MKQDSIPENRKSSTHRGALMINKAKSTTGEDSIMFEREEPVLEIDAEGAQKIYDEHYNAN